MNRIELIQANFDVLKAFLNRLCENADFDTISEFIEIIAYNECISDDEYSDLTLMAEMPFRR